MRSNHEDESDDLHAETGQNEGGAGRFLREQRDRRQSDRPSGKQKQKSQDLHAPSPRAVRPRAISKDTSNVSALPGEWESTAESNSAHAA